MLFRLYAATDICEVLNNYALIPWISALDCQSPTLQARGRASLHRWASPVRNEKRAYKSDKRIEQRNNLR